MEKKEIIKLSIDLIEENPWNPNAQSDAKFNKLVEEIENMGFLDPIQVVPMPSGMYRIIGGAHRYNAGLILGMTELPAIVLDDPKFQDVDLQKFLTLRLNLIHGKMTKDKFSKLYEDLAERYSEDFIKDAMALVDKGEFDKIKKDLLENIKDILPEGSTLLDGFDDTVKELKTLDDMTKLLEDIFHKKEKGEQLPKVLAFGAGGGKVVYFPVSEQTWAIIERIKSIADTRDTHINEILAKVV